MYHYAFGFVYKYRKLYFVGLLISAIMFCLMVFGMFTGRYQVQAATGPTLGELGYSGEWNDSAASARWINANSIEITIGTKKMVFQNQGGLNEWGPDGTHGIDDLIMETADHTCPATVEVNAKDGKIDVADVEVVMQFATVKGGPCVAPNPKSIHPSAVDTSQALAFFRWVDKGRIETVDGKIFERDTEDVPIFRRQGDDTQCTDFLYLESESSVRFYELSASSRFTGNEEDANISQYIAPDCNYNAPSNRLLNANSEFAGIENAVSLGIEANSLENRNKDFGQGTATGTGVNGEESPSCDTNAGALGWFMCPIFNGIVDANDWIFRQFIQPYLQYSPIDPQPGPKGTNVPYEIWSSFRVIGNIILAVALIVAIFGQSLGGGLIDAYTAKKMLPRILIAAILVNLSIYFVAFATDVTNVVGNGIGQIITAPLSAADELKFKIGTDEAAAGFLLLIGAIVAGAWAKSSFTGQNGRTDGGGFMIWILMIIFLPLLLITIGIFITLILRRTLILLLAVVSPVAFALYVIPATEKYFKKWWETFAATLIVYPIIVSLFAIADVMSALTARASSGLVQGVLGNLVSFVILFIPLAAIPFSFKLAGGFLGNIYGALQSRGAKARERALGDARDPNSMRSKMLERRRNNMLESRGRMSDYLQQKASGTTTKDGKVVPNASKSKFSRGFRRAATLAQRGVAYGNLEAQRSDMNRQVGERIKAQSDSGGDTQIRGFWARRRAIKNIDGVGNVREFYERDADGLEIGEAKYMGEDGKVKEVTADQWSTGKEVGGYYENLDGGIVSDADYATSRSQWGGNISAVQQLLNYELGKAGNDRAYDRAIERFMETGQELGLSEGQMNEVWGGVKFMNKGARLNYKHTGVSRGADGSYGISDVNQTKFSQELADSIGTFDYSRYRSSVPAEALRGLNLSTGAVQYLSGDTSTKQAMLSDTRGLEAMGFANDKNENGEEIKGTGAAKFTRFITSDKNKNVEDWKRVQKNYLDVADNVRSSPDFVPGSEEDGQAQSQQRPQRVPRTDENGNVVYDTQVGGSARAKKQWDAFVTRAATVRPSPPSSGGNNGGPGGGGTGGGPNIPSQSGPAGGGPASPSSPGGQPPLTPVGGGGGGRSSGPSNRSQLAPVGNGTSQNTTEPSARPRFVSTTGVGSGDNNKTETIITPSGVTSVPEGSTRNDYDLGA